MFLLPLFINKTLNLTLKLWTVVCVLGCLVILQVRSTRHRNRGDYNPVSSAVWVSYLVESFILYSIVIGKISLLILLFRMEKTHDSWPATASFFSETGSNIWHSALTNYTFWSLFCRSVLSDISWLKTNHECRNGDQWSRDPVFLNATAQCFSIKTGIQSPPMAGSCEVGVIRASIVHVSTWTTKMVRLPHLFFAGFLSV
jgi:hypothetical protein